MNYKFRVNIANNNYDLVVGYRPHTFSEYGYEIIKKSDLIQSGNVFYADITFNITNFKNSQGVFEHNNLTCLDEYNNTLPIYTYAFQYDLGNNHLVSWMESEEAEEKLRALNDEDRDAVSVTQNIFAEQTTSRKVWKFSVSPNYINRFAVLLSDDDDTVTKTITIENTDTNYKVTSNLLLTNSHISDGNGHNYFVTQCPSGMSSSDLLDDGTIRFYEEGTTLYCNYFTFLVDVDYELPVNGVNYESTYHKDALFANTLSPTIYGEIYEYSEVTPLICQEYDSYVASKVFSSATDELMCSIFNLNPKVVYLNNFDNTSKIVLSTETINTKNEILNPYGITVTQQS